AREKSDQEAEKFPGLKAGYQRPPRFAERVLGISTRERMRDELLSGEVFRSMASEMLLRSQRKLHHAFQELVRRQADEVVHDELLGVEADEVAQLQRLAARGIDEIPVPVVDHDDVALGISARAPGLSRHKQRRAGAP